MTEKVNLSNEELKVLSDIDFLLTKRKVTNKIILILNELDEGIEKLKQNHLKIIPGDAFSISSKISKGENYLGLPFIILDNPRLFSGNDAFAFRSMFWWGNFISFTIHISGKYFTQLKPVIPTLLMQLKKHEVYVCINPDQWQHHFENNNYVLINDYCNDEASINKILQLNFLKLAVKISISDNDKINKKGIEFYGFFLETVERLK